MTAQLSREELKQQLIECIQNAYGMFEVGEDAMCAMMALLEVMSSEPVAKHINEPYADPDFDEPAPVAVPDEDDFWLWLKNKMPTTFRWARELEETPDNEELIIKGKSSALDMLSAWNACRAAMLQGGKS